MEREDSALVGMGTAVVIAPLLPAADVVATTLVAALEAAELPWAGETAAGVVTATLVAALDAAEVPAWTWPSEIWLTVPAEAAVAKRTTEAAVKRIVVEWLLELRIGCYVRETNVAID